MNGPRIKLVLLAEVFPESALADAIDEALQRSLPSVPGLDEAHTPEACNATYAAVIDAQCAEFVEQYGDPYAWERRSAPREGAGQAVKAPLIQFVAAD